MNFVSKLLYLSLIKIGAVVESSFNSKTKNAFEINQKLLFSILKENSNTEIGKNFNFKSIQSLSEFKNNIPLTTYNFYEDFISRMVNGEDNLLFSEKLTFFGQTSGTTGSQKLIPFTKSRTSSAAKYMGILSQKFSYNNFKNNWNYGRGLMISDIVVPNYTSKGIPICSATSGGMNSIKGLFLYLFTSPTEIMEIKDKEISLYLHILFALQEKNLLYISSIFISNILDFFRSLEKNFSSLITDLQTGTISSSLSLDSDIRKLLTTKLTPNPTRAIALTKLKKSNFKGIAKKIWPSLSFIATVTGGNFTIYNKQVNYYTDNIPIHSTAYACTEGMIGLNPNANKVSYVLTPDTVFFEFILAKDSFSSYPKTYTLNELQVGSDYEIVITNSSGLYRYRMGDIVKVVGYFNSSPEIEFIYRKNQLLNMVSEKTTEEHINIALKNTMLLTKSELIEYSTTADNSISPGRYIVFMEIKSSNPIELNTIENIFDLELRKANLAYDRFRSNNRLSKAKILFLPIGTFANIISTMLNKGVSKNQIKIPRVIQKDSAFYKELYNKKIVKDDYGVRGFFSAHSDFPEDI